MGLKYLGLTGLALTLTACGGSASFSFGDDLPPGAAQTAVDDAVAELASDFTLVGGNASSATNIPTSGGATFDGDLGFGFEGNIDADVVGDVTLVADFANNAISGTADNFVAGTTSNFIAGTATDITPQRPAGSLTINGGNNTSARESIDAVANGTLTFNIDGTTEDIDLNLVLAGDYETPDATHGAEPSIVRGIVAGSSTATSTIPNVAVTPGVFVAETDAGTLLD